LSMKFLTLVCLFILAQLLVLSSGLPAAPRHDQTGWAYSGPKATPALTVAQKNSISGSASSRDNPPNKTKKEKQPEKPINITADRMEADDKEKVVVFTGNVVARQEDVVINCDLMRVYYREIETASAETTPQKPSDPGESTEAEEKEKKENEIDRIEAEGNVKITRDNRVALSDKAVYLAKADPRVIILTGEPRVWRDKDVLTGKRITVFLDQDRSLVEGGAEQRVNATFYQKKEDKKEALAQDEAERNNRNQPDAPGKKTKGEK